jgi:hypothetical protein
MLRPLMAKRYRHVCRGEIHFVRHPSNT